MLIYELISTETALNRSKIPFIYPQLIENTSIFYKNKTENVIHISF